MVSGRKNETKNQQNQTVIRALQIVGEKEQEHQGNSREGYEQIGTEPRNSPQLLLRAPFNNKRMRIALNKSLYARAGISRGSLQWDMAFRRMRAVWPFLSRAFLKRNKLEWKKI